MAPDGATIRVEEGAHAAVHRTDLHDGTNLQLVIEDEATVELVGAGRADVLFDGDDARVVCREGHRVDKGRSETPSRINALAVGDRNRLVGSATRTRFLDAGDANRSRLRGSRNSSVSLGAERDRSESAGETFDTSP